MQSLNDHMAGCTVFSKIDLVKACHQILIAEENIPKTAIATPYGLGITLHGFRQPMCDTPRDKRSHPWAPLGDVNRNGMYIFFQIGFPL
jgi:hypothetical protein